MKTTPTAVLDRFDSAISTAKKVLTTISDGQSNHVVEEFATLQQRLKDLPPNPMDDLFLNNTVRDAAALFTVGQLGAARWQLQQVLRRLQKLRTEWLQVEPLQQNADCIELDNAENRKSVTNRS